MIYSAVRLIQVAACCSVLILPLIGGHAAESNRTPRYLIPEGKKLKDFALQPLHKQLKALKLKEYQKGSGENWELARDTDQWDLLWSWAYTKFDQLGPLQPHHRVNHIPGNGVITVKALIFDTTSRLQKEYGEGLFDDIVPRHFILPKDSREFEQVQAEEPNTQWILKSQGHRGVRFLDGSKPVSQDREAMKGGNMVAQCVDPFLVGGYKFDIGVFVLVASLEPLRIFIHNNPKMRFCQLPYPEDRILTSAQDPDSYRVAPGHRPTAKVPALKKYFQDEKGKRLPVKQTNVMNEYLVLKKYMTEQGLDATTFEHSLHQKIVNLVAGIRPTLLRNIRKNNGGTSQNFFELFRFDFVVDKDLNPWLMEVNLSPNMVPTTDKDGGSDAPAKENILMDALKIVLAKPASTKDLDSPQQYTTEQRKVLQQALGEHQASDNYKMVVPDVPRTGIQMSPFMGPLDELQWDYFSKKKVDDAPLELPKETRVYFMIGGGAVLMLALQRRRAKATKATQ